MGRAGIRDLEGEFDDEFEMEYWAVFIGEFEGVRVSWDCVGH